ncbi:interleukin 2 receptor, gamma a [Brachyhypopomus gauderio]|uniref:interleukin 2 receptor, gamma a n=1 Tax=Brachyhypopomus gauderio TaxID=698409 RepID=UPI0040422ACE
MLMFLLFLFGICPGCEAKSPTNIRCVVMNLEYVNCTWDEDGTLQENYTFRSRFEKHAEEECSTYLRANNVNVGCILPYSEANLQRFDILHAWVYRHNGSVVMYHHRKLTGMVKLDPPYNVTASLQDPQLWIYWNTSSRTKPSCKESEVRYRTKGKEWEVESKHIEMNSFGIAFPQSVYEFQVRVRMSSNCGQSDIWSEWSSLLHWSSPKNTNDTVPVAATSMAVMVMYTAGAAVLLITLSCLLMHSERLRVILVPVVPSPKNLGDLIESYDGNVEKWLSISKELQDGFKPNFTERPCPVREYRLVPQASSPGADPVSSSPALTTDYQLMHSYSASTLPVSRETTQAPPPATARVGR